MFIERLIDEGTEIPTPIVVFEYHPGSKIHEGYTCLSAIAAAKKKTIQKVARQSRSTWDIKGALSSSLEPGLLSVEKAIRIDINESTSPGGSMLEPITLAIPPRVASAMQASLVQYAEFTFGDMELSGPLLNVSGRIDDGAVAQAMVETLTEVVGPPNRQLVVPRAFGFHANL